MESNDRRRDGPRDGAPCDGDGGQTCAADALSRVRGILSVDEGRACTGDGSCEAHGSGGGACGGGASRVEGGQTVDVERSWESACASVRTPPRGVRDRLSFSGEILEHWNALVVNERLTSNPHVVVPCVLCFGFGPWHSTLVCRA